MDEHVDISDSLSGSEWYRRMASCADALFVLDKDGKVLHANSSACTILGLDSRQVQGIDISSVIQISSCSDFSLLISQSFSLQLPVLFDGIMSHGALSSVCVSGTLLMATQPDAYIMVLRTIPTDSDFSTSTYASVLHQSLDAIVITDANLETGPHIVYVNEAFVRLTGYSPEEVIGLTPRILKGAESSKDATRIMRESIHRHEGCTVETINYRKDGSTYNVNISISPIRNAAGICTHFLGIHRNITGLKTEKTRNDFSQTLHTLFTQSLPNQSMHALLNDVLQHIVRFGHFALAEIWLTDTQSRILYLKARHAQTPAILSFYHKSGENIGFKVGEGLPGFAFQQAGQLFVSSLERAEFFLRKEEAALAGLQSAYAIPLIYAQEKIGVLLLFMSNKEETEYLFGNLFDTIGHYLGIEIRKKQIEEELSQVFSTSPDMLCMIDSGGYFRKANPSVTSLLGYTLHELHSTTFTELVHADDKEQVLDALALLIQTGQANFETRMLTNDGRTRWVMWACSFQQATDLCIASGKDITERKEQELLVEKAGNMARFGGWEADIHTGELRWSCITSLIFDREAATVSHIEAWSDLFIPLHKLVFLEIIQEAIEQEKHIDLELLVKHPQQPFWVRIIADVEYLHNKPVRLFGSVQDVDEKKKYEEALSQSLREKRDLLETISEGFMALDKDWKVVYWNKEAERVFGISRQELLGQTLFEVVPDANRLQFFQHLERAFKEKDIVHFEEYLPPMKQWFEAHAYPSFDGMSVFFHDITKRKRYERRLQRMNMQLKKQAQHLSAVNAELEQFAFVASHDLQEPLRMVIGFLSQIEKKYNHALDEKGKKYIEFAIGGAKKMRQLILDLLDYSKIGHERYMPEPVNLNNVIDDVIFMNQARINDKRAKVESGLMPVIQTFKAPVRQVFHNLLANALKFSSPHTPPEIEIGCSQQGSEWLCWVKDNGIGIEPEHHQKIFEVFQRLHSTKQFSGTGIGLAVVRKIIETLGGKIWVESYPGKGSTFFFTLKNQHREA